MAAFVVGLTGGVASGKSELGRRFQALGVTLVDADLAAREVVAPGQAALVEIAARFGPGMLDDDGQLDRVKMRALVFTDADARRDLEAITHPRIRVLLRQQADDANGEYALVAIPLLAEAGGKAGYPWLQRILVVDTPARLQRERLMARDQSSRELAEKMIAAQAGREVRLALADDVVINDAGMDDLAGPVERLDALYRALAYRAAGHGRALD